jgi:hypothetical protein
MSRLASGILLFACTGSFSREFCDPMMAVAQREIDRHGSLVLIVDGWHLAGVDTAYREAWTAWFKLHKDRFRMTLLVQSRLLEMAASLANLFTGISVITTYSSVSAWEEACARDVPGFRRRSVAS